jgi:hypothetical protein
MEAASVPIPVPIQWIGNAALALTCLIGLAVGLRTLAVWARTRRFPELAIGLYATSLAGGGMLLVGLRSAPDFLATPVGRALWGLSLLLLAFHALAMYFGTWKIFRPDDRWPLAFCLPACAAMVVYFAWGWVDVAVTAPRALFYDSVRFVGFAWTSIECFRYAGQLRRRARLGLGDAFVAHRITLWGIASTTQLTSNVLSVASSVVLGLPLVDSTVGLLALSLLGLGGTICLALAFFPPRAYARWVGRALDA